MSSFRLLFPHLSPTRSSLSIYIPVLTASITTHHSHSIRAQAATLSFAELTHTAAQAITNAAAQEAGKWTSACSLAPPLLFCSII